MNLINKYSNSLYFKGALITLSILFLYQTILPLMILNADTPMTVSEQTNNLILKKYYSKTNYNQYTILEDEIILIKRIDRIDSKFVAGHFVEIENNYINLRDIKKDKIYHINTANVDLIYSGNVQTWKQLRTKWNVYVSGSAFVLGFGLWLTMPEYDMSPGEDLLCASMLGGFYAAFLLPPSTIASYIDYEIRKGNARKFIIGSEEWTIATSVPQIMTPD